MKKIILPLLLILTIVSCDRKEYKYKIEGQVKYRTKSGIDSLHSAIAYTDTIHGYNEDSIWYYNSDGSKLTILNPYIVSEIK